MCIDLSIQWSMSARSSWLELGFFIPLPPFFSSFLLSLHPSSLPLSLPYLSLALCTHGWKPEVVIG